MNKLMSYLRLFRESGRSFGEWYFFPPHTRRPVYNLTSTKSVEPLDIAKVLIKGGGLKSAYTTSGSIIGGDRVDEVIYVHGNPMVDSRDVRPHPLYFTLVVSRNPVAGDSPYMMVKIEGSRPIDAFQVTDDLIEQVRKELGLK